MNPIVPRFSSTTQPTSATQPVRFGAADTMIKAEDYPILESMNGSYRPGTRWPAGSTLADVEKWIAEWEKILKDSLNIVRNSPEYLADTPNGQKARLYTLKTASYGTLYKLSGTAMELTAIVDKP